MTEKSQNGIEETFKLVRERLEFVEIISQLNVKFLDPNLIACLKEDGHIRGNILTLYVITYY